MNISLPQAIPLSFYAGRLYREVAQTWRSRAAVYLFLVLVLCWTPAFVKLHRMIEDTFDSAREKVLPQVPTVRIEKGVLRTPELKPYILQITEGGQTLRVVIDTTGRYQTLEQAQAIVLITDKMAMVRRSNNEIRSYTFSTVKDTTFGPADVSRLMNLVQHWIGPIVYPFVFIFSYLKRLVQAVLTACIGLLLIQRLGAPLSFPALFSLATVSMTPTLVVSTFLGLGDAAFPLQWLLLGFVNFGYFLFAINAATDTDADDPEPLLPFMRLANAKP
jgi:hypothetical protein